MLRDSPVPVRLFTENKYLFDAVSKGTRTSEKRLILDIAAAKEGFESKDISDIGFVRSNCNLADGLTKRMKQASLLELMKTCKLSIRPEQWIVRH